MRTFLVLGFTSMVLQAFGQTASPPQDLPKDPRQILALASPLYDYSSADLKPFHLKASYQLYDEKGDPSDSGTYEYWYVSPVVQRSTWTRGSTTHTDWKTLDGKSAHLNHGEGLHFFEYRLQSSLLSALPTAKELDPTKVRLDKQQVGSKNAMLECVSVIPLMPQHGLPQQVPLGLFPTYCFDPHLPALRVKYSFGTLMTEFTQVAKFRDHYLAREIVMMENKRKILTASLDSINVLDPSDPALIPSPAAVIPKFDHLVEISSAVSQGLLEKKEVPVFPEDARAARVSGTVVLDAIIGADGAIHDLQVVTAPFPSLAASALGAVSQWRYRPYLLNGEPVEVQTTINVIFSFGP